jgi:hypothetical protein
MKHKPRWIKFECKTCGYRFHTTTSRWIRIMADREVIDLPNLLCNKCLSELASSITTERLGW